MLELSVTCNMMQVVIFCFVIRYCCMKYEVVTTVTARKDEMLVKTR